MAIRNSRDESFDLNQSEEQAFATCLAALSKGGFSSVQQNRTISQISANYHKFTVGRKIEITIKAGPAAGKSTVCMHTTANMDNIYALFTSPIDKIANAFKSSLDA